MGRLKAYKKLLKEYGQLGFREPYQVLVTADLLLHTIKVDLTHLLEKAMGGKVKMMITSCCIRVLYQQNTKDNKNKDPNLVAVIERAKGFERCRCGHLMDSDPLTPAECLMGVINHKGKGNVHRYFLATQDETLRRRLRQIAAVPLIYCKRSVMVLEPMSDATAQVRRKDEMVKYRDGLRKRKRAVEPDFVEAGASGDEGEGLAADRDGAEGERKRKKRKFGLKGPNPLSVKKPKKRSGGQQEQESRKTTDPAPRTDDAEAPGEGPKRKRKRKRKHTAAGEVKESGDQPVAPVFEAP